MIFKAGQVEVGVPAAINCTDHTALCSFYTVQKVVYKVVYCVEMQSFTMYISIAHTHNKHTES